LQLDTLIEAAHAVAKDVEIRIERPHRGAALTFRRNLSGLVTNSD